MARKRIVIVEDEPDMAELVAMGLRRRRYEVDVAYDGLAGLEMVRSRRPDLVLLDIMLPGLAGTEVLAELRKDPRTASVPVIVLTARTAEAEIVGRFQEGADDYVTKPFSMSVLLARVEALLRRIRPPAAEREVLTVGPIRIDRGRRRAEVAGRPVALTATEFRLLLAILVGGGRVLTRQQLIDQALGPDAVVTDRTIDVHLTALRKKLGAAKKYIGTVRGVGYRLATEDADAS